MEKALFSSMALDALGEIMNISLGSSATAVSNMLDQRVDITTPKVSVVEVDEFSLGNLEPAMGVEIKYVSGLEGSNIMLLKRSDIKMIVDILMGSETPDEEFELNELTISAVCELMNQMMGAAATALSDFLGYSVNISTPLPFELDDLDHFKETHLPQGADTLVVVRFALRIEETLESEFMNVMSVDLAKDLISGLGMDLSDDEEEEAPAPAPTPQPAPASSGDKMSQEEIEKMMAELNAGSQPAPPPPAPASSGGSGDKMSQEEIEKMMAELNAGPQSAPPPPAPAPSGGSGDKMSQEEIEKMLAEMNGGGAVPPPSMPGAGAVPPPPTPPTPPMPGAGVPGGMPQQPFAGGYGGYPPPYPYPYPYPYPPESSRVQSNHVINTSPVEMPQMDLTEELGKERAQNLDLIMEVPLQVTVEIGRTQKKVQDILSFSKGSLVVLDKLAGDQVDIFVNGKCIARGDVVVIDDNFGVRITEIVQKTSIEGLAGKAGL